MTSGGNRYPAKADLGAGQVQACWRDLIAPVSATGARTTNATVPATACHDRLVGDGIDLSAYNLAEMAADVEDVRTALAIDRWTLAMRGASSTIGFEVMRRFPEHIQAAYFDSPDAPQVDLFSEAIIGTRYAIARLSEACGDDPRCTRSFPHLEETVRHDLAALHRDPARIPTAAGELTFRDTTLIPWIREWLATSYTPSIVLTVMSHLPDEPAQGILSTLADEALEQDDPLATWAADELTLNLGYAGPGYGSSAFSDGTFFSVVCHDELPFVDRKGLRDLAAGEPWFEDA